MKHRETMSADMVGDGMCALSEDRKLVRLIFPPLRVAGMDEPLDLVLDFDRAAVSGA